MSNTKIVISAALSAMLSVGLILAQPPQGGPPGGGKGGPGGFGKGGPGGPGGGKGAPKGGGGGQPGPPKQVTIAAIPGVIAASAQWKEAWEGPATADGIAGTDDGGLLFAQEQTNMIGKLDKDDHFRVYTYAHGPGAISIGADGKLYTVERTCTDPGLPRNTCMVATDIAVLTPERKILADKMTNGDALGRLNDLSVSKIGHVYATTDGGPIHMKPTGEVERFGMNLRVNGIILSPDEKILYVTNGGGIAAFDIGADGTPSNQRDFAMLPAGANGDGMAIDSEGRLYVTGGAGINVVDKNGMNLGVIPTARNPITVAFSGPDKKWLYVGSMGVTMGDGKEYATSDGRRNTAMTVYKIQLIAQGFKGRAR